MAIGYRGADGDDVIHCSDSDAFILRKRHCFWQEIKCKKNRDIPSLIKKYIHTYFLYRMYKKYS